MSRKEKRLRAAFKSKSGKDVEDGFYYEVIKGEAIPSNPDSGLHRHLSEFGYPLRTDYGIQRVFPSDGDIFVRNLPKEFSGTFLWVDVEEVDISR